MTLHLYLLIPLAPLVGVDRRRPVGPALGRGVSHWMCILGVAIAFVASFFVFAT